MYQKKEKNILQKLSPHLSQLNVAMAHRNYFRRNNLWILKLATYTKKEDHYSRCNWQLFRLERIAKCSYFILFTQNIRFHWSVMKIKKFLLPIWWYNRDLFPLRNKCNVVFVLNGSWHHVGTLYSGSCLSYLHPLLTVDIHKILL